MACVWTNNMERANARGRGGGGAVFEKQWDGRALLIDRLPVAWKRKQTKLTADIIGHVPREISRAVYVCITHEGKVTGSAHRPRYFPSSIATFIYMHCCPGTMTTHAESINSDLQPGLDSRLRNIQH